MQHVLIIYVSPPICDVTFLFAYVWVSLYGLLQYFYIYLLDYLFLRHDPDLGIAMNHTFILLSEVFYLHLFMLTYQYPICYVFGCENNGLSE